MELIHLPVKIATLTLNPALDKSTHTDKLVPEQKLRCTPMHLDAGGGGINVSKGICKLGGQSMAVFPAGGGNGEHLRAILHHAGIDTRVVQVAAETRENISVTENSSGNQFRFTTSGLPLTEKEADACLEIIRTLQPEIIVASGSLPPGLPETYYEKVAHFAKQIKARLVLDTSGTALLSAADEGLFMLKPNLAELSALVGADKLESHDVDEAAMKIIETGKCEMVAVSLGPQGALLVTRNDSYHVPAPPVLKRSTVGAGDSMVAGMVWALNEGKSPLEMVQLGVACGSAATLNEGTELFHKEEAMRLFKWIRHYGARYQSK